MPFQNCWTKCKTKRDKLMFFLAPLSLILMQESNGGCGIFTTNFFWFFTITNWITWTIFADYLGFFLLYCIELNWMFIKLSSFFVPQNNESHADLEWLNDDIIQTKWHKYKLKGVLELHLETIDLLVTFIWLGPVCDHLATQSKNI